MSDFSAVASPRQGREVVVAASDLTPHLRGLGFAVSAPGRGEPRDGKVSPGFLAESYALYRSVLGKEPDAIVFDLHRGAGYCTAAARRLGLAFPSTAVVLHCRDDGRSRAGYASRNELGWTVTERLTLELADALVCDEASLARFEADGWSLPARRWVVPGSDAAEAWSAALQPTRREPPLPAEAPLVSVVVPRHQRTDYLPACLEALGRQDYPALEVIVVDDGSTGPGPSKQLDELEARTWPWPLTILRLPHQGVSAARNAGWRAGGGDLVLFVDDDDVPFDHLVSSLVRSLSVSEADAVAAGARHFRSDGEPRPHPTDVIKLYLGRPRELGLLNDHYGGPVVLWRRELLERIGGFAIPLLEDWEILARATAAGADILAVPEPLYWYRLGRSARYSAGGFRATEREQGAAAVAAAFAAQLPDGLRLLPQLAQGAYDELDRRKYAAQPARRIAAARLRSLTRQARRVRAEEGFAAVARAGLRYLRGRT